MIFHAIEKVVEAGVEEIFINVNPEETQLQSAVGDGGRWGVKITFYVQEGGPQGIAHVVKCAEPLIGNDPFIFYLSDNIVFSSLKPFFEKFDQENLDCLLALSVVPDPERFGVPAIDADGKLVDVFEKPAVPPSNFAVTGIYLFNHHYFKAFSHITKSARGEYEIPSIFSYLLKNGYKVGYKEITGWWKDTGKPEDLLLANQLLLERLPAEEFKNQGVTAHGATIRGKVYLGSGTTVGSGVGITGPVMIGENCTLENCQVGPNVSISAGSTIRHGAITNSILLGNVTVDSASQIRDSIIGEQAKIVTHAHPESIKMIVGDHTVVEL